MQILPVQQVEAGDEDCAAGSSVGGGEAGTHAIVAAGRQGTWGRRSGPKRGRGRNGRQGQRGEEWMVNGDAGKREAQG
eukprot:1010150-Pleurochrysis_carterae.AAC.1